MLHKALESLEEDFSPLYDSLKGTTAIMFCNTANVPAKLNKDKAKDGIPGLKARDKDFDNFIVGKHRRLPIPRDEVENSTVGGVAHLTQNPNY